MQIVRSNLGGGRGSCTIISLQSPVSEIRVTLLNAGDYGNKLT